MYSLDAMLFRERIADLRRKMKATSDPVKQAQYKRRIADLQVLVRQSRELAVLTRRYYERGYHKDEGYTL